MQTDRELKEVILLVGYYALFNLQSYCLPALACIILPTVLEAIKNEKNLSELIDTR
jgi:hypothetical protein